jgi:hypothetical protein
MLQAKRPAMCRIVFAVVFLAGTLTYIDPSPDAAGATLFPPRNSTSDPLCDMAWISLPLLFSYRPALNFTT